MRCVLLACLFSLAVPMQLRAGVSRAAAESSLLKATGFLGSLATEGGYLWWYAPDLKERWGEGKATATQIWVQPPGTPAVGMALLRAWETTKNPRHLLAAEAAALALARGQLASGGWDYLVEFDPKARRKWAYRTDRAADANASSLKNTTTFDDDNTQSALRFLMAYLDAAKDQEAGRERQTIRAAAEYGLAKMLEAQYPNGAWPQRYDGKPRDPAKHPVQAARFPTNWSRTWTKPNYAAFYTFNDHTQRDCIRTMLAAHRHSGERRFLEAARRGGEFIVRAQMPEPQPAWAQQYNFAMEPDWARAFEPPAISAGESAGVLRTLAELYLETGDPNLLKPIPAAIAWYHRSRIAPGRWARFYEMETNTPIYGDRDGKIYYRLDQISAERREGYAWEGGFGIPEAIAFAEAVQREGREKHLARQKAPQSPTATPSLRDRVAAVLSAQDANGRWLSRKRIEMQTFIRNVNVLCDYLEAEDVEVSRQR
jgi:PelA/Pel-15E family pectate lyase